MTVPADLAPDVRRASLKQVLVRVLRRAVPSASRLTYHAPVKLLLDTVDLPLRLAYPEFRHLPPNHMRVRVGVGHRYFTNQVAFLQVARDFWYFVLAQGYCRLDHTILDIGVGCGRYAQHLRDYGYCGSRFTGTYIGIDIDDEMLAWCRNNFPDDRFRFHRSSHASASYNRRAAAGLPYTIPEPDQSVDFVFATSLFTHLLEAEVETYLREACRLLRPGGWLVTQCFCLDMAPPTLGGRHTFRHRIGNAHVESLAQPEAAVAYTSAFLLERARANGFDEPRMIASPDAWQPALVCRKPDAGPL